jgi:nitroreductase
MKLLFDILPLLEKTILIGFIALFFYCFVMTEWKKERINEEVKIQKLDDELKDRILRPYLYKNGEL